MGYSLYLYFQLFIINSDPKLVYWEILRHFQLLAFQFMLSFLCSLPLPCLLGLKFDACQTCCPRSLNCHSFFFLSLTSLFFKKKRKDFERFHFKNFIICVFLHVGKCIYEYIAHGGPRRTLDPLELELVWLSTTCNGCWEVNSGPLQDQEVLVHPSKPILASLVT